MEKNITNVNLTDAFYVGVITALGYIWSYFREFGYKSFYHIPNMFIEIEISTVFKSFGESWVYIILWLVIFCFFEYVKKTKYYMKAALTTAFICVSVLIFILLFRSSSSVSTLLVLTVQYIAVIILLAFVGARFPRILVILGFAVWLFISGYYIGVNHAANKSEYLMFESSGLRYVILDTYKGFFIVAPITDRNEIIPAFELIEQKSDKAAPLSLTIVTTGPLTVKQR